MTTVIGVKRFLMTFVINPGNGGRHALVTLALLIIVRVAAGMLLLGRALFT